MTDLDLTEAVEAAARTWQSGSPTPNNWENMSDRMRSSIRARMGRSIAIVAPIIERQVRESIRAEINRSRGEALDAGEMKRAAGLIDAARIARGDRRG